MTDARLPLLGVVLLLWAGTAAVADDQARDLLQRMDRAVGSLNYEGTFVHVVDGKVETMHVVHRVEDGKVTERLVTLDGPSREIIRDDQEVTCIFADQKSVLVERRRGDSPLRAALPRYSDGLEAHYEFVRLRDGMRLGRKALSFEIRPRDRYRYGYRLWMDEASGMLLKAQLIDIYRRVAEQLMFVSINLPEAIDAGMVEPTIATEDFTWYVQKESNPAPVNTSGGGWRAADLPPGFELTTSTVEMMAGAEHPTRHLVYSDGIASVSVFIEQPEGSSDQLQGETRIGAASAFSVMVGDFQVTAMGEVPPVTVEMIAGSISGGETAAR
ncbi:MAG: MucB/RseB C-terminal domain-containing protein [Gammaproteobacteria bacterium]|jgi:sigma-E factor negative regulatory protein RseB